MSTLTHTPGLGLWLWTAACVLWALPAAAQNHSPAQSEPAVLTVAEAADLLRIAPGEVVRLAEARELPARRVGAVWRFNRASLLVWLNGDWEPVGEASLGKSQTPNPKSQITSLESQIPMPAQELQQVAGTSLAPGQATPQSAPTATPQGSTDTPIGEAPEERTAEQVFLRGRRVLLGRGDVVVDFGQFYTRGDDLQLATSVQGLGLATVRQEALTSLVLARVGVLNETEVFASTTFNKQTSHLLFGGDTLARDTRTRLGGVSLGVNRTLLREQAGRPDVIANFAVHIPTDDAGAYALSGGLSLVKSVDPAVLFATVGYSDVIGHRSVSASTSFEPAASVSASVGYGLGLNDTMAISTTFSGLFTGSTVVNGAPQHSSQFFSGRFALTSRLAEGLYIEPSVSFGISGPSDSVAFGLTVPYSF